MKLKFFSSILLGGITLCLLSCNSNTSSDEQAIRTIYEHWKSAAASRDVNKIMAFYAPSDMSVFYDAFPPRQYTGTAAYRKDYENFLTAFPGPLKSDLNDVHYHVSGNIAYVYGVDTWTVTGQDNQPISMVFRFTDVLEKLNGKWLIVHEHLSFPFDPVSGKADFMSKS